MTESAAFALTGVTGGLPAGRALPDTARPLN